MMDLKKFQESFSAVTHFKENRFHPLVWINGEPEIGENVYIGGMSEIYAKGAKVVIGDDCDIASFVVINCADSHIRCLGLSNEIECKDIIIENNVFIGSQSVVKGGAHIGHHSVIAAGTIVDGVRIPPYSLVFGNRMQVKEGYYFRKYRGSKIIRHNNLTLDVEEKNAVAKVITSGWLSQGEEVKNFERELARFLGLSNEHIVVVSSGSAALFLALLALNAKNKKIAIPVYTCSSLRHAVNLCGAKEEIIDCAPDLCNINVNELLKSKVDVAIIPHMFGIPVNISCIKNIKIIEDCAQAIGASVNDIHVGLSGDCGIFSFYATKLLTSGGEGGAFVSRDKKLVDFVRDYISFDQRKDKCKNRFNFHMTELQAAVGREQLKKLPLFLKKRAEIFYRYKQGKFNLLDGETACIKPVRYRAVMNVKNANDFKGSLFLKGIESIIPIEEWELLDNSSKYKNALDLTQRLLSLPLYPSLTGEEVEKVIKEVRNLLL